MKYLHDFQNVIVSVCLIFFFITSCTKQDNTKLLSFETDLNGTAVKIENGMLYFSDDDAFRQAILANQDFDQEASFLWEKENDFTSMWRNFTEFQLFINEIGDRSTRDGFMAKRAAQFNVTENGIFYPLLNNRAIGALLNWEGKVVIGNHLYCFRDDYSYIILDRDEEKLANALRNQQADETQGVFVIPQAQVQTIDQHQRDPTFYYANCPTTNISVKDFSHQNRYFIQVFLNTYAICNPYNGNLKCDQYVRHSWGSYEIDDDLWYLESINSYMDSDGDASPIYGCSVFANSGNSTATFSMASTGTNIYFDETIEMVGYTISNSNSPCLIELDIPTSAGSTYVDRTNDSSYGQATDDLQVKIYCQ